MKKNFLLAIILFCSTIVFAQNQLIVHSSDKGLYLSHKVTPKENFYSIGRLYSVSPKDIEKILGKPRFSSDVYKNANMPGVAVGLAYTYVGGDILFIETSLSDGKGELRLTGNLGNVMKESASTALTYLQSNAKKYGIDPRVFEKKNIHIHVPEGAVPKDGPSAGVTMLAAIASAFTGKKIKPYLGMTGEITLRGQVLPVGGIKEKVLAAKRAGLKEIILCWQNEKDIEEINSDFIKGIELHFVKNMKEVLELALGD